MNMLSSHRITPSIVSGYGDHVLDQSSLKSSHLMISDRSSDRQTMAIDRPGILNDRISFASDRSNFSNERASYERYGSERSAYHNERSRDRDERKSNGSERINSIDRSRTNISYDRPSVVSERPDVSQRYLTNGHKPSEKFHYSPDRRHATSPNCPKSERPTISIEPCSDRSNISSDQADKSPRGDDHGRKSKSPHNPLMSLDRHPTSYCKTSIFRGEMMFHNSPVHLDSRDYSDRFSNGPHIKKNSSMDESNDIVHPRSISESEYINSKHHPYNNDRPSPKHNTSQNNFEHKLPMYTNNNNSIVSSSSVHPIMVSGLTRGDSCEKSSPDSQIHSNSEHLEKGRWKNFDFVDKSGEYSIHDGKSSGEHHHKKARLSPYSHEGHHSPSMFHSRGSSKSPNFLDVVRHDKGQLFDRQADKSRLTSRSPSNHSDESERKSFHHETNGTTTVHGRTIFPPKVSSYHSPEQHSYSDFTGSKSLHQYSPKDSLLSPTSQDAKYPSYKSSPEHNREPLHSPSGSRFRPSDRLTPTNPDELINGESGSRSPLMRPRSNPQYQEEESVPKINGIETVTVNAAEVEGVDVHVSPFDENNILDSNDDSSTSKLNDDATNVYDELNTLKDEHSERMAASPVPPVVILNPEDVGDDDDMTFDEQTDDTNDAEMDDNTEDDANENDDDMNHNDHPMLSSERPSMLSDSPSMVSMVSARPSMVGGGDGSGENGDVTMTSSDRPNVVKRGKRKKYQKYTPADRIAIGKFCFEHGPAAARKAFQSRYPEMSESVTRGFRDKYKLLIGEYAVYCYEQKRRKEMHARTESLPRGRPRKYKQVDGGDEKPMIPTSAITLPPSQLPLHSFQPPIPTAAQGQPPFPDSTPPPPPSLKSKVNEHSPKECNASEDMNNNKTYTREEKLLIGWFCAKHGADVALNVFTEEHPDLTMEMVVTFHKLYIKSEGRVSENDKADVFVVDSENNSLHSPNNISSSGHVSPKSETNSHSSPSPQAESLSTADPRNPSENSSHQKSPDREFGMTSSHDENTRHSNESRSSAPSPTRPLSAIPVSSHSLPPIIHYPKISPDGSTRDQRPPMEPREFKHEPYNHKMELNGEATMGYPYDRQMYMYGGEDNHMTNGTQSLPRTKRFKYQKYSPEDRYNIGKLCNDIGLGATVKVYREQFPRLNESVVRTFRNKYRELLQKGNGVPVTEAIQRKPSRRSITTVIESEVVSQLRQFKQSNIEINEKLVIAIAENVIATKDQKDIGPVKNTVTAEWASSLLWKHKLVDRQVSNPNGVCCERCKTPLVCPKC